MKGRASFCAAVLIALGAPESAASQRVHCSLILDRGTTYSGECSGFNEGTAALALEPDRPVSPPGAAMALPLDVAWTGPLEIPGWPTMVVDVEMAPYSEPAPVMKTDVAWLLLENAVLQDLELSFAFDFDRDAPPTVDDLEIVEGAIGILNHEMLWDRSDNHRCLPGAKTWTLYCALHDATVDVTGEFHEFQPALVITRDVIGQVFREMQFEEPIIEYNTYDDAILIEMHRLLAMAATRIRGEL